MTLPVRVLVVDDSALMRKLIPQALERDPCLQVVATAMDGAFALEKIPEMKPDVITLDLEMPRMDGTETLREIMRRHPLPVVVVSAHSTQGAAATFKALAMGAIDFVAKPGDAGSHLDRITAELIAKVKVAAQSAAPQPRPELLFPAQRPAKLAGRRKLAATRVVAIGISTGGPNALQYVLSQLPADFPGAILVVQHMPEGFTEMFARRLDECCAVEVKEACSGDLLLAGRVLICPGNRHMRVRRMPLGEVVVLSDEERVNGHRPSVEVLFHSVAQELGARAIALLMTGMGEDGAEAMGAVKAVGGLTVAQSAESCVVYGMPRAAVERGHVMRIVPLDALAHTLAAHCAQPPAASARQPAGHSVPA
jgi:two-component system chemotaxis response regulator CheB